VTFDPTTEVIGFGTQQQTSRHSRPTSAGGSGPADASGQGPTPPPFPPPHPPYNSELRPHHQRDSTGIQQKISWHSRLTSVGYVRAAVANWSPPPPYNALRPFNIVSSQ